MVDAVERSFLDLHCHSSASFDSVASPARLMAKARRIGLTHLAITEAVPSDNDRSRPDRARYR